MNAKYTDVINEAGCKCELCGSTRNIEVHHIIPRCCEIDGININDKDNLLVVCSACHSKLTPKAMLVKYGLEKAKRQGKLLHKFYEMVDEYIEDNDGISSVEIMDIVESVFGDVVSV